MVLLHKIKAYQGAADRSRWVHLRFEQMKASPSLEEVSHSQIFM